MPVLIDCYTCVNPFNVEPILIFTMDFSCGYIQEWAANNETRGQIEDTVLYGYYSKFILLILVSVGANKKMNVQKS